MEALSKEQNGKSCAGDLEFKPRPLLEELSSFSKMLWVCVLGETGKRHGEACLGKGGENHNPLKGGPHFLA